MNNGGVVGLAPNGGRHVFCGGLGECARRLSQLKRGTLRIQKFKPVSGSTKSIRIY